MADLLQTLITAVTLGSLYALIALGYTMVYGILKLINFAHSDVVTLGAWSSLTLATVLLPRLGVAPGHTTWWAAALVLTLTMLVCAVVGFLIERLAYKPIRNAPRLQALITAIGVSLVLQNAGQLQYTISDGVTHVRNGTVRQRGDDPKTLLLTEPVTIKAGTHYVMHVGPPDKPRKELKIIAPPGDYAAGTPVRYEGQIGKSELIRAPYALDSLLPPVRLPFGAYPGRAPNLLPVLTNPGDPLTENVLWHHDFKNTVTLPDGTSRTYTKTLNVPLVLVITVTFTFVLLLALHLMIYHTRLGMAMRAVSYSTDHAALMGIPIDRVISITFVTGAVLAAAAGFLYSQMFPTLQQTASYAWVLLGLKAFVAAVVGGIGNVRGAVVGAFLISTTESFGSFYLTKLFANATSYSDVLVFLLLIFFLLIKPSGLFGTTAQEKV